MAVPEKTTELLAFKYLFGLIGFPLGHSFSKKYFTQKFQTEELADHYYELFPLEKMDQFPALIQRFPNLRGLNITIPYKEAVLPFLDKMDAAAAEIGAVNTILVKDGKLKGYNTDVFGFEEALRVFINDIPAENKPKAALVLGTGGAAKGVMYVLKKRGLSFQVVSRHQDRADLTYQMIDAAVLAKYPLIINTTPLGMAPAIDTCPAIPYDLLTTQNSLFDLVYNPEKTLFLEKGTQQGCPTQNGLGMLVGQAEKAWELWNRQE